MLRVSTGNQEEEGTAGCARPRPGGSSSRPPEQTDSKTPPTLRWFRPVHLPGEASRTTRARTPFPPGTEEPATSMLDCNPVRAIPRSEAGV
eukprot:2987765-Rhodomonas_salina.2